VASILKLRVNKKSLALFFLILPHLKPEAFDYAYPLMGDIFNIGRILSVIILVFILICKKYKASPIIYIIALWQLWVLITTALNSGDIHRAFILLISTIALTVIVDYYSEEPRILIETLFFNFSWLIVVNFFSVLFFPNGLYTKGVHNENICYFLGFKNSMFCYFMSALIFAFIRLQYSNKKIRSVFIVLLTCSTCIMVWSASTLVAIGIFFVFLFFMSYSRGIFRYISFNKIVIGYILIDILLCVFGILSSMSALNWFITQFLQKDITLSGRTSLWSIANIMIVNKPFIGYGVGEHIEWHGYSWYGHNQIYNALLESGIIGLFFYAIIIGLIGKKFKSAYKSTTYYILICAYIGIFALFLVEAGTNPIFFIFYVLGYNICKLGKNGYKSSICKNYFLYRRS